MCTQTLHIKNPIKRFIPVVDKPFLDVPCGKCWECRQKKRNDYYVRSFFEYERTRECGFTYFLTLTYDDKHINKFVVDPRDMFSRHILVFRHGDIRKYIDRVKSELRRVVGDSVVNNHVRYFLTSEYGDDEPYYDKRGRYRKATNRPHYHILWFVSSRMNEQLFRTITNNQWTNGITYDSDTNHGIINGYGGLKYVSKYVSKDIYQQEYFAKILRELPKNRIDDFKKIATPVIRLSSFLGLCALDRLPDGQYKYINYVNDTNLLDGYINLPDKKFGIKRYKLPLYYERYLFYDAQTNITIDGDEKKYSRLFTLNENGRAMKVHRFRKYVQGVLNRLYIYLYNDTTNLLQRFNIHFNTHATPTTFTTLIRNLTEDSDFVRGAITYRNMPYEQVKLNHPSTPFEDFKLLYTFDRQRHTLDDWTEIGITYADLFDDIVATASHFNKKYKRCYEMLQWLVEQSGIEKEEKHLQQERYEVQYNKLKKQQKRHAKQFH